MKRDNADELVVVVHRRHWCIDNPRTDHFAQLLHANADIPLPMARLCAVGMLEMLRHFTADYCPDGNPGKWRNSDIASALHWVGDADLLVAMLVECGWLKPHPTLRLTFRVPNLRPWMPKSIREAVIARDGMCCQLCGGEIASRRDLHVDHIHPYSHGGETVIENLQVAHAACNVRKGARLQ